MTTSASDVVLLRSADPAPDRYVEAFAEVGLEARCEPVLRFRFPSSSALRDRFSSPSDYAALLATSPRAATALDRAFERWPDCRTAWEGRTVYVVGPKTGRRMQELGLVPEGVDTGSAEALVQYLREHPPSGPLLFLSGNRRRDTIPNGLEAADIAFEEEVVYETHSRTSLDLPPPTQTTWLVFFSPSGLEAVQQAEVIPSPYRIAAIGPTTAGALRDEGLSVTAVAEQPSPDGLVAAIQQADVKG